jgi:hypothetical protein
MPINWLTFDGTLDFSSLIRIWSLLIAKSIFPDFGNANFNVSTELQIFARINFRTKVNPQF